MKMTRTLVAMPLLIGTLESESWAATRTVCFEIQILDERFNCSEGFEANGRRPCDPDAGQAPIKGFLYELWDKDSGSSSNDEFIGTYWMSGTGVRCATFEWENASYSLGEAHPDVYVRLLYRVRGSASSSITLHGTDGAGNEYTPSSWRDSSGMDVDEFVAVECQNGSNCNIKPGEVLIPIGVASSDKGRTLQSIDSAQRTLEVFDGQIEGTDDIKFRVDALANLPEPCSTACARHGDNVYMPVNLAHDGGRATHEIGHLLQTREFDPTPADRENTLQDDCGLNGTGWSINTIEKQSCATTEGWATYVSIASWYDPTATLSFPVFDGEDLESEILIDSPNKAGTSTTCAEAKGIAGQVAKAFWDMDDVRQESGTSVSGNNDDINNLTSTFLLNQWADFPDSTSNRGDYEANADGHAVNMWDYRFNAPIGDEETFFFHNCLDQQNTD